MATYSEVFSLQNEIVVITGGGTGIGKAMAEAMHAAGARVILVGRRAAELESTAKEIGERVSFVAHDITNLAEAPALIAKISAEVGPITCLVNNAGQHLKKSAVHTSTDEFQKVLTTHVLGAHALTIAVAPGMIERKHGTILFTASMASLFGIPLVVAYSAAKTALLGMVRTLACELSPHGIRVNAIAPGWIETEMSAMALAGDPARRQKILGRTPAARLGESSDVGWAAVYLASPAAKFVTGVVLPVDGGASIGF
jgi:NAD(P)-dependent dehydrogenase (short-subunit alcohol dehydrogenase family)